VVSKRNLHEPTRLPPRQATNDQQQKRAEGGSCRAGEGKRASSAVRHAIYRIALRDRDGISCSCSCGGGGQLVVCPVQGELLLQSGERDGAGSPPDGAVKSERPVLLGPGRAGGPRTPSPEPPLCAASSDPKRSIEREVSSCVRRSRTSIRVVS